MGLTTNIITVSVIIFLIYIVFKLLTQTAYTGTTISASTSSTIDTTDSVNCAYSVWIYIENWSNLPKTIFSRGGSITQPNFSLNLGENKNFLTLQMPTASMQNILSSYKTYSLNTQHSFTPVETSKDYYYSSPENCENLCSSKHCSGFNYYSSPLRTTDEQTTQPYTLPFSDTHGCKLAIGTSTPTAPIVTPILYSKVSDNAQIPNRTGIEEFVIDNAYIPLQEWVFITINVTSFYVEVYINGKLVRTIASKDSLQATGDVLLTPNGGFDGKTSDFKFYKTDLTATQIWNNYRSGFGKYFSLSDYSIKIKFNEEND